MTNMIPPAHLSCPSCGQPLTPQAAPDDAAGASVPAQWVCPQCGVFEVREPGNTKTLRRRPDPGSAG